MEARGAGPVTTSQVSHRLFLGAAEAPINRVPPPCVLTLPPNQGLQETGPSRRPRPGLPACGAAAPRTAPGSPALGLYTEPHLAGLAATGSPRRLRASTAQPGPWRSLGPPGGPGRPRHRAAAPHPGPEWAAPGSLTRHGEVVEGRLSLLHVLRPLLVADEGAVVLEQEVAGPPGFDVLPCGHKCGGLLPLGLYPSSRGPQHGGAQAAGCARPGGHMDKGRRAWLTGREPSPEGLPGGGGSKSVCPSRHRQQLTHWLSHLLGASGPRTLSTHCGSSHWSARTAALVTMAGGQLTTADPSRGDGTRYPAVRGQHHVPETRARLQSSGQSPHLLCDSTRQGAPGARSAPGTAEQPGPEAAQPLGPGPRPHPRVTQARSRVPPSFATSAVNRRPHRSEQMSSVIFKRLSFFILTPRKNVSFTFCRARSLNNSGKLTNEAAASSQEPWAGRGWGPRAPGQAEPPTGAERPLEPPPGQSSPRPPRTSECGLRGPSLSAALRC